MTRKQFITKVENLFANGEVNVTKYPMEYEKALDYVKDLMF